MGLLGKHTDQIGSAMERKVASSKRWAEYISRQFVCDRFASTRNEYSSLPPVDVSMALRTRHALYGRGQMAASATTGHLECFSVDAGCIRLSCDPLLALDSRHFDSSNWMHVSLSWHDSRSTRALLAFNPSLPFSLAISLYLPVCQSIQMIKLPFNMASLLQAAGWSLYRFYTHKFERNKEESAILFVETRHSQPGASETPCKISGTICENG